MSVDPSLMDVGNPLAGVALDSHRFLTQMPVSRAIQLFLDPNLAENARKLAAQDASVREAAADREVVQRLARVTKAKRDNVPAYARYIKGVVKGEINGSMPTVDAWVEQALPVKDGFAYVPFRTKLIAFDGDTQMMAIFRLCDEDPFPELMEYKLPVVLFHDRPQAWAAQQLADRNLLGVKMSAGTALGRDTRDPITKMAREVADQVGLTLGLGRQVSKSSSENVTISAWRQAVAATILGRSAAQLGMKPIELPEGIDVARLAEDVRAAWAVIVDEIRPQLEGDARLESVATSPTVLFALGVCANHTLREDSLRAHPRWTTVELRTRVRGVEWRRRVVVDGQIRYPWEGITGKANREKGTFSVGGVKEYGHAAAEALEDPLSTRGRQVRTA